MKKLTITDDLANSFKTMISVLFPKQEPLKLFGDGMVTLKCTHCLKTTSIHWYELLYDHIMPELAKRLTNNTWRPYYIAMVTDVISNRLNGKSAHPITTVYNTYFLKNIHALKESTSSKEVHLAH